MKLTNCKYCGKEFLFKPSRLGHYCSWACFLLHKKKECKHLKEKGKFCNSSINRGKNWNEARKKVYERDKLTCQGCGEQNVVLHIHHLVPWNLSKSNSLTNLVSLCHKCHVTEENEFRRLGAPSLKMRRLIRAKYPISDDEFASY